MKQRDAEWHAIRQNRLTASDFGAAANIKGSFISRQKLYKIKTGQLTIDPTPAMAAGIRNEPVALKMYEVQSGNVVFEEAFVIYSKNNDFGGSPDGIIHSKTGRGILEIKCPQEKMHHRIPAHYLAQIQGLMEICDLDWCDFVSFYKNAINIIRVDRDQKYWADFLEPELLKFWEFVKKREEPPRARKN